MAIRAADGTLRFVARREAGAWVLRCDDLPGLEVACARLTDAHSRVRAVVAEVTGAQADELDVVIAPVLPDRASRHVESARELQEQIQELVERAAAELTLGVHGLLEEGLTQREIALALGLTASRVSQLAAAPAETPVPLTVRHMQHLYDSGALRST